MTHKSTVLIIMGVSGCGKTTLGNALARKLNWQFKDADDYHSKENKNKMRKGLPLEDSDRLPWLRKLAGEIEDWIDNGKMTVLACSALKNEYRTILSVRDQVQFAYLKADKSLLQRRLDNRDHEYMNPRLLESQLDALEEPQNAITLDAQLPLDKLIGKIEKDL